MDTDPYRIRSGDPVAIRTLGRSAEILGVPVHVGPEEWFLSECHRALVGSGRRVRIVAVNPEKVISAQSHVGLLNALHAAELRLPDGVGLVAALRRWGWRNASRVTGIDFTTNVLDLAEAEGASIFLLGARSQVVLRAASALAYSRPRLKVAGWRDGYGGQERESDDVRAIVESGVKVLIVGMGSPRQEAWVHRNWQRLETVRVCLCVGGTIDVMAGHVRRAPRLVRAMGMEWLYRLAADPRRLARQTSLPQFVRRTLFDGSSIRASGREMCGEWHPGTSPAERKRRRSDRSTGASSSGYCKGTESVPE